MIAVRASQTHGMRIATSWAGIEGIFTWAAKDRVRRLSSNA
jgi:hypothetical protein